MGTRSLTYVYDTNFEEDTGPGKAVVCIYRQMDGYLEGMGTDLATFLADMQICNGYGTAQNTGRWANGAGCLAAQLVKELKNGIGSIYLRSTEEPKDSGQDYTYRIYAGDETGIEFVAFDNDYEGNEIELFRGPPAAFLEWVAKHGENA